MMEDAAEFVSNMLAVPTLGLCAVVVVVWTRSAWSAIWHPVKTPAEWILIGVWFAFTGETLDNLYWTTAWTLNFLGSPWGDWLTRWGFVPNIPFRQCLAMIAAYCHLRAYVMHSSPETAGHYFPLIRTVVSAFGLGAIYATLLRVLGR